MDNYDEFIKQDFLSTRELSKLRKGLKNQSPVDEEDAIKLWTQKTYINKTRTDIPESPLQKVHKVVEKLFTDFKEKSLVESTLYNIVVNDKFIKKVEYLALGLVERYNMKIPVDYFSSLFSHPAEIQEHIEKWVRAPEREYKCACITDDYYVKEDGKTYIINKTLMDLYQNYSGEYKDEMNFIGYLYEYAQTYHKYPAFKTKPVLPKTFDELEAMNTSPYYDRPKYKAYPEPETVDNIIRDKFMKKLYIYSVDPRKINSRYITVGDYKYGIVCNHSKEMSSELLYAIICEHRIATECYYDEDILTRKDDKIYLSISINKQPTPHLWHSHYISEDQLLILKKMLDPLKPPIFIEEESTKDKLKKKANNRFHLLEVAGIADEEVVTNPKVTPGTIYEELCKQSAATIAQEEVDAYAKAKIFKLSRNEFDALINQSIIETVKKESEDKQTVNDIFLN